MNRLFFTEEVDRYGYKKKVYRLFWALLLTPILFVLTLMEL